jgi:hypothetical protein
VSRAAQLVLHTSDSTGRLKLSNFFSLWSFNMRSLLRFLAFAGTTLLATLQVGFIVTTVAARVAMASSSLGGGNLGCAGCCGCSQDNKNCAFNGVGRSCTNSPCASKCNCKLNLGSWLCKHI